MTLDPALQKIEVASVLIPKGNSPLPVVRAIDMEGGYHAVANEAARDAITSERRYEGMLARVNDTGLMYTLGAGLGNADWNLFVPGLADAVGGGGSGGANRIALWADADDITSALGLAYDLSSPGFPMLMVMSDDGFSSVTRIAPSVINITEIDTGSSPGIAVDTSQTSFGVGAGITAWSGTAIGSDAGLARANSAQVRLGGNLSSASTAIVSASGLGSQPNNFYITHRTHEVLRDTPTALIFNEAGDDHDFRVEGDTNPNLFSIDAGFDTVGIGGAATSGTMLTVTGEQLIASAEPGFAAPLKVTKAGEDVFSVGYTGSTLSFMRVTAGGAIDGVTALLLNGQYGAAYSPELNMSDGTGNIAGNVTLDVNTHEVRISTNVLGSSYLDSARFGRTATIFNDGGADIDFRIEGDTIDNLFVVNAGLDVVGIGTFPASAGIKLTVAGGSVEDWIFDAFSSGGYAIRPHTGGTAFGSFTGYGASFVGNVFARPAAGGVALTSIGSTIFLGSQFARDMYLGTSDVERIGISSGGNVVINEFGAAVSEALRVESDTQPNALLVSGSGAGSVSCGTNASMGYLTSTSIGSYSNTQSVVALIRCGVGTTSAPTGNVDLRAFGNGAGGTTFGIANATSGQVVTGVVSSTPTLLIGTVAASAMYLGSQNVERMSFSVSASGVLVINDTGVDYDLRAEGDTDANLFTLDAGLDRAGFGVALGSAQAKLHVQRDNNAIDGIMVRNDTSGTGAGSAVELALSSSSRASLVARSAGFTAAGLLVGNQFSATAPSTFTGGVLFGALATTGPGLIFTTGGTAATDERLRFYPTNALGGSVFNENGEDWDIRFESDTDANLLFIDAGALSGIGAIGLGTNAPTRDFHARRTSAAAGVVTIQAQNDTVTGGAQLVATYAGTVESNLQAFGTSHAATQFGASLAGQVTFIGSGAALTGMSIGSSASVPLRLGIGGVEREGIKATETVFNESGGDFDFRVEGDTNVNLFQVDAGLDAVGIGAAAASGFALTITGAAQVIGSTGTLAVTPSASGGVPFTIRTNFPSSVASTSRYLSFGSVGTEIMGLYATGSTLGQSLQLLNAPVVLSSTGGAGAFTSGFVQLQADSAVKFNMGVNGVERLSIDASGNTVWNETGADSNFRLEGDTDANLFTADAGLEMVGIGVALAAAAAKLHVDATGAVSGFRVDDGGVAKLELFDGGVLWHKSHVSAQGDGVRELTAGVQTTGATPAVVTGSTFTLSDNTVYWIEANVSARESGGTDRAAFKIYAAVYRQGGGGATIEGAVADVIVPIKTVGAATWAATFTVTGNDVRVSVTGVAATTIDWTCTLDVQGVN